MTATVVTPAWKRWHLIRALEPAPDLTTALAPLIGRDWARADAALARHFGNAPQRFVVGPRTKQRLVESIREQFPDRTATAAAAADRILAGEYDLLGYRRLRFDPLLRSGGRPDPIVDWHADPVHARRAPLVAWPSVRYLDPSCGDHKIIWELNRHQHWLTLGRAFWLTGNPTYRDRFVYELEDWLEANPPLMGINWASMLELAMRCLSWTWALHLFVDDGHAEGSGRAPWMVDLLLALDLQLTHIERHLSCYFSPNTHLLGEALALYVCGLSFPELRLSPRRVNTGRRVLLAEINRQIGDDGGHLERSTHYHRYTLDFYLLALIVGRINRDPAAGELEGAVSRLATAAQLLADSRGRLPHIGDDDGGMLLPMTGRRPDDVRDSLAVAARLLARPELDPGGGRSVEEAAWLLGHEMFTETPDGAAAKRLTRRGRQKSAALEDTGYYISRNAASEHLVIDGGSHGYQNGGHAHADALSITLSVRGVPLLIDPGTACYTSDAALRDRFRSTALHNTVTVDGRPSSVARGPFQWSDVARTRVHQWQASDGFDYFDGEHDGYRPLVHRRRILAVHGDLLIVADLVDGSGTHDVAVHWHIHPEWSLQVDGRRAALERGRRRIDLVIPDGTIEAFSADPQTGLGWHSPEYGRVEPATTLRVARRAALPAFSVTVIGLDQRNRVHQVTRAGSAEGVPAPALACRIVRSLSEDELLITDARVLLRRSLAGGPVSVLAQFPQHLENHPCVA